MTRFLAFAHEHNVMPDVLAWHEWGSRGDAVASNVAATRAWMDVAGTVLFSL
jgi:hypothetical protein